MSPVPCVAVVHDLSGLGRCSLGVVLPTLSAMGAHCCALPTAVLSAHTAFPASNRASFVGLTDHMAHSLAHWEELGAGFDAIYSGFLGSEAQIDVLSQMLDAFRGPHTVVLVDPVMGDQGQPYRTYTPKMCARMAHLADKADIITPNLTEAALLLSEPYSAVPNTKEGIEGWLCRLSRSGKRSVVITGVSLAPGQVGAACLDRDTGETSFAQAAQEPGQYSGTGDLFASVVLGSLLRGESLPQATQRAVTFIHDCVAYTNSLHTPILEGVAFEPLLPKLF